MLRQMLILPVLLACIQKGECGDAFALESLIDCLAVWSIDCFKCVSFNGENKYCDDPFHNNVSLSILESPCMGGRKGRDGLFPATSCVKIAGYFGEFSWLAENHPEITDSFLPHRRHWRDNNSSRLRLGQRHLDHGHRTHPHVTLWTILLR